MTDRAQILELRLRLGATLEGKLTPEELLEAMSAFIREERGRIERAQRAVVRVRQMGYAAPTQRNDARGGPSWSEVDGSV